MSAAEIPHRCRKLSQGRKSHATFIRLVKMGASSMSEMLLEIRNASKVYKQRAAGGEKRDVVALQNFNLSIARNPASIITIAGESGSGKTTLAQLVLGFTHLTSGEIIFDGQDMSSADATQMKDYRRQVQAVFQDPFGVYNPFYRIAHVFTTVINNFKLSRNKTESRDMIEDALNIVGLHGEDVL